MVSRGARSRWSWLQLCAATAAASAAFYARADERPPEPEGNRTEEPRTVLFGSLDGGRSAFATIGLKHAIGPSVDRDGWFFLGYAGAGGPREAEAGDRGLASQGNALFGYQWNLGRTLVAGFAGPEFDLDPPRAAAPGVARWGLRLQGEVWSHPTENLLVTGTMILASAREHLWGRASTGYRMFGSVFVGPEIALYRSETYRETRLGLHATGITAGRYTLRLSVGYRQDDDRERGGYAQLSAHTRM